MNSAKIRVLALLLWCGTLVCAREVMPGYDCRVSLTVTVAPTHGITLEFYDEWGQLAGRSDSAVPPAIVSVGFAGGDRIGLGVPAVALSAPATVRAYVEATPQKREIIADADRKAAARGLSAVPERDAIEFVSATDLGTPTTICLSYPEEVEEAAVDSLRIFRLDENEASWQRLASCALDPLASFLSAEVEDFGVYRMMACTSFDLGRLLVFPNPFSPDLAPDGAIKFVNLTRDAAIRIFDVEGRLIWKKEMTNGLGAAAWHGTTSSGQAASSGIYLFTVTDRRGWTVSGKIALVR